LRLPSRADGIALPDGVAFPGRDAVPESTAIIEIKKSRFLAETFLVSSQEQARSILKTQKERHADASHVVHAFVIGSTGGILGCSDDGEPSGTAGRPVLDVLKGSQITNILVTVARWFGGTLLGTGGLVKAYSESVRAVLAVTPVQDLVPVRRFSLAVPYELYDRIRRDIDSWGIDVTSEEFGTDVSITGLIRESLENEFCARVGNLSAGRTSVRIEGDV
jgi:uncharacterized YigZ family protein